MKERLDRLDPGRGLARILLYRACYLLFWAAATAFYRLRTLHADRVPLEGPLLVIANHQSHADPVAIGLALRSRNMAAIARLGLFRNRLFAWLLRHLNAIPINEREADSVAIRRAIAELHASRCVLLFPEGTRSPDGAVRPFKRGVWLLIARAKCPVLPIGVDGAFDAWPRGRSFPHLWGCRIAVSVGEPIVFEELAALGSGDALALLQARVTSLQLEARTILRAATTGRYPAPGPTDARPE